MIPSDVFLNGKGLTDRECDLYGKQIILNNFGISGQKKLKEAKVALVGVGGIGSTTALYLCTSGIGTLKIIDGDNVEISNLHRQVIHSLERLNTNKAVSAAEECRKRNDTILVIPVAEFLTENNVKKHLNDCDIIVDATDNYKSRYLINDYCVTSHKPAVFGCSLRWEGQVTVFNFRAKTVEKLSSKFQHGMSTPFAKLNGLCYRCLCPSVPPANCLGSCDMEGVFGAAPGIIGMMQATEVIKLCLGLYENVLDGKLMHLDLLNGNSIWRTFTLRKPNRNCICSEHSNSDLVTDDISGSVVPAGGQYALLNAGIPEKSKEKPEEFLKPDQTISSADFFKAALEIVEQEEYKILKKKFDHSSVILDVRPRSHFCTVYIEGSTNLPLELILSTKKEVLTLMQSTSSEHEDTPVVREIIRDLLHSVGVRDNDKSKVIYCLCRKGKDATKAVQILSDLLLLYPHTDSKSPRLLCVADGLLGLKRSIYELRHFPLI